MRAVKIQATSPKTSGCNVNTSVGVI